MFGDEGRPKDAVGAVLDVHLDEPVILPVENCPVHVGELYNEGPDRNTFRLGVLLVHADVGDLGIGIGAPGDGERAGLLPHEREPEQALELRDPEEEDPAEARAAQHDLSYVKLDGSIGCMVNGAGLAMGTMDIIQHAGGKPANFLDVGGDASVERVTEAFKIITEDESVRAILVNIFGGIVKVDLIAEGILAAVQTVGLEVPLIVRLEGTNVERGRELLAESGLPITPASDMADAAQKVVGAVG